MDPVKDLAHIQGKIAGVVEQDLVECKRKLCLAEIREDSEEVRFREDPQDVAAYGFSARRKAKAVYFNSLWSDKMVSVRVGHPSGVCK